MSKRTLALVGSVFIAIALLPPPSSALTVESETGLYSVPQGGMLIFNITSYPNTTLYVSIMHVDKYSYYSFYWHEPLVTDVNGSAFMVYSASCVDEFGKLDLLSDCGMDVPTDANEDDRYILMISDNETHRKITIDVTYSGSYQDAKDRARREAEEREDAKEDGTKYMLAVIGGIGGPLTNLFVILILIHALGWKRIDVFDKIHFGLRRIWRKIRRYRSQIEDIPSTEEQWRRKRDKVETRLEYLVEVEKEQDVALDETRDEIQAYEDAIERFKELEEAARKKGGGWQLSEEKRKEMMDALKALEKRSSRA